MCALALLNKEITVRDSIVGTESIYFENLIITLNLDQPLVEKLKP
jgi:hypothetical protein